LNPSLFASGSGETITAPAGSTVVLNIIGGTIPALTNSSFTFNGISASNVILNLPPASQFNLAFQGSFPFSVLAPEANVSFNSNGAFHGTLIANSVTATVGSYSSEEFEDDALFAGSLPSPAPEPAPMMLIGGGLVAFGMAGRRRRR
jgi:choice-of-anchor A domain-containing protein